MTHPTPKPATLLDENGVLVYREGSDLEPSTPVRVEHPRRCFEHPPGVVVVPKDAP